MSENLQMGSDAAKYVRSSAFVAHETERQAIRITNCMSAIITRGFEYP